jgi:hypothetical protein
VLWQALGKEHKTINVTYALVSKEFSLVDEEEMYISDKTEEVSHKYREHYFDPKQNQVQVLTLLFT